MLISWWCSCRLFTVRVTTDVQLVIVAAAPIVRRFIGQPLSNLERWQKDMKVVML